MSWTDITARLLTVVKSITNLELQFKNQGDEIILLRKENGELRKEIATMAERLARLEESRKTTAAEVKLAVSETLMELKMEALQKENDALKRRQIPSADGDS